jgi:glycosyltransferase involved in cell wall biosynthesis
MPWPDQLELKPTSDSEAYEGHEHGARGFRIPVRTRNAGSRVYMMDLWSFIPYYVASLCKSLRDDSVRVVLGSARYHLDREYFHKVGITPDPFLFDCGGSIQSAASRRIVKTFEYLANLLLLSVRFSFWKPDIVHVQFLPFLERGYRFELWFLQWIRRQNISLVYTVHNLTPQNTPDQFRALYTRAYRMMDCLICHSEEVRLKLTQDFGVRAEKIKVIPHGPLFDEKPQLTPDEARTALQLPIGESLVLYLGVISEYKGVLFLLDAWKRVIQQGGSGRLVIAGTGDPRIMSEIRERILEQGIGPYVDLRLRFISVEQVPMFHQAADVIVYPYKTGTTSGALLTGLNYGKAVVATSSSFFSEHLKNGEEALLIEYGDVDGFARALLEVMNQPQMRERLGHGALKRSRELGNSWARIACLTKACYREMQNLGHEEGCSAQI